VTCGSSGQWGSPWTCATGACGGGACTGSTASGTGCQAGGAGMSNCGATTESCCTSLEVSGGTYDRTYTNGGDGGTGGSDPATLSGFRLDKYDVTVGRFRQFVTAWNGGSGWMPAAGSGTHTHLNGGQGLANSASAGTYETGWSTSWNSSVAPTTTKLSCGAPATSYTWTASAGSNESLPINCPNWYESYAFCIWDGGFLPSEAEWIYAAAGGSEQREYAWGSTAPGLTNQYAIYGDGKGSCNYPTFGGCAEGVTNIAPVGTPTLGAGRWGQLDLAGNLLQWNLDWYATYVSPCTDCAYLMVTGFRVPWGGDFYDNATYLNPWSRNNPTNSGRYGNLGFRCARTP